MAALMEQYVVTRTCQRRYAIHIRQPAFAWPLFKTTQSSGPEKTIEVPPIIIKKTPPPSFPNPFESSKYIHSVNRISIFPPPKKKNSRAEHDTFLHACMLHNPRACFSPPASVGPLPYLFSMFFFTGFCFFEVFWSFLFFAFLRSRVLARFDITCLSTTALMQWIEKGKMNSARVEGTGEGEMRERRLLDWRDREMGVGRGV